MDFIEKKTTDIRSILNLPTKANGLRPHLHNTVYIFLRVVGYELVKFLFSPSFKYKPFFKLHKNINEKQHTFYSLFRISLLNHLWLKEKNKTMILSAMTLW